MNNPAKTIPVQDVEGFRIGSAENREAMTGCTVILADGGAVCGLDVRGGAPASRESALLNPLAANDCVHAVLLSGGSAFGLDAASGVMKYLEERGIGFATDYGVVPIVCASCLFDLGIGDSSVRPDAAMGYAACTGAETMNFIEGSHGAGCGATVGKFLGARYSMKSGIGAYALQAGSLKVAAIAAVNAAGDVYDERDGSIIAGVRDRETGEFLHAEYCLYQSAEGKDLFNQNTTIGAILTNGIFTKTELTKIAGMAHNGYARAIRPVHTMYDGDSIYALASGRVRADINVAGSLAADAMAAAIRRAAGSVK